MGENKAVAMAKKAHAAFKAGDIDGVVDCWDENIVHQSHAPTADEPWMGVFKGVEESKKMLAAWGELAPSFSFTEAMFIPVDDTTCLQCMESKLSDGSVLHELVQWKVNPAGDKMVYWELFGDPYSYKKLKEGKPITHEYFYPGHVVPPAAHAEGAMTAKEAAKLCHEAFAAGDVEAITAIWSPTIIHAVCPATPEIPHSGVHVGKEAGLAWLGNYAMSEIKYEWVEETCIEVNPNLCFTFAKSTYPDGTTGVECMRWITTEDGKLVSWTCFGNTVKHAAGGK